MLQVINKQSNGWTLMIYGRECFFSKKLHLFTETMKPLNPNANGGLRWRLNGKWVSYKQIKSQILLFS